MSLLVFNCYSNLFSYGTKACNCLISFRLRPVAEIRSKCWWKRYLSCYIPSSRLCKRSTTLCI